MSPAPDDPVISGSFAIRRILRQAGPRLARDGFGPLLCFFLGWKLATLGVGIALAVVFGVVVYHLERRAGRPALVVRLALLLVLLRAVVGISSGSGRLYLAQEIGIDALLGSAVLASLASSRSFAERFSADVFPLPEHAAQDTELRAAMRRITLVFGVYFFARGAVRLVALLTVSTNAYALVIALTDVPVLISLLIWSVMHTVRVLRRGPHWEPLLAGYEVGAIPGSRPR